MKTLSMGPEVQLCFLVNYGFQGQELNMKYERLLYCLYGQNGQ